MPNKPHPPRNKPSKASAQAKKPAAEDDTSYIVFGDKDKSRKKVATSAAPTSSKPTETPDPDAPKRPDTRTLIGGSSWTGKLPLNLLSEHCQKQKWEKPEYTMHSSKDPKGFASGVILRYKNTKTHELIALPPIRLPKEHESVGVRDTAVEARHFAAAYALYRVANGKNLHMMMPPQFRDLWKADFVDMKKEAESQGHGWHYEADPFAARARRDEGIKANGKKIAERQKRIDAEKTNPEASIPKGKGWARAPKVDLGRHMRQTIEKLVRTKGTWNPLGLVPSHAQLSHIVDEVSALGFRKSHVEEAMEYCSDKEEALEWLLIHVPEDDLPKWSLPDNYAAGVSLASSDLQREGKLKRLATTGFAPELCDQTLEAWDQQEAKAAEALQNRLVEEPWYSDAPSPEGTWEEEQETLAAIYGERYASSEPTSCRVKLEPPGVKQPITVHFRNTTGYPQRLPTVAIDAPLPAYVRLAILQQCLTFGLTLLGQSMIFDTIDWLETNVSSIIDNPGKLSSITSALGTTDIAAATSTTKGRKRALHPRPRPIDYKPSVAGEQLLAQYEQRQSTVTQQRMMSTRQNLPAWRHREAIVRAVNESQVTIISGETGSGKSTQSVQFILDDMISKRLGTAANIICTQPRRISALGLADRVADERCGTVGDEIGYIIRGESRVRARTTKITFVTTGILMRRLQTAGGSAKDVVDSLADVSHIVIDEVHERGLDTDLLMALLRGVLKQRKSLKLILMSATLDADVFERYFADTSSVNRIEIAGRTHPVRDIYIDDIVRMTGFGGSTADSVENMAGDDSAGVGAALRAVGTRINYDLIAQTVECIDTELGSQDGGILIFLPGVAEIDRTLRVLQALPQVNALPLHASLQSSEQRKVFVPSRPGKRKVIAATNVAETSITIEDIVAVIDTGRVKETSYDPITKMVRLEEVWASRAACKQRRGRAGRVRAGVCYKLYTRVAETSKMAERPEPEIRRVPLDQLCLSVKAMGIEDVAAFLAGALTPPESLAVQGAMQTITRMGAMEGNELTALGRHLAMIPADLRCGKLLVYGAIFGCLEECLTIASILSARSPFVSPQTQREEAKAARAAFSGDGSGDLLCDLRAYEAWTARRHGGEPMSMVRRWCGSSFLSYQTLEDISSNRKQYVASLQEIGFLQQGRATGATVPAGVSSLDNSALLRALVAASFTPQIARIEFPDTKYIASVSGAVAQDAEARAIKFFAEEATAPATTAGAAEPATMYGKGPNSRVFIHPSSTLFTAQTFAGNSHFMAYFTKMATSKVFIRELTPFNTFSALLFCGKLELNTQHAGLVVDGWIKVRGWARIGVLVSRLRVMLDELLAKKIDDPGLAMQGHEVVGVVRRLIEFDGMDR